MDSGKTHTILREMKYFQKLTLTEININTISGSANVIEDSGRAYILLSNGTKLDITEALYSSRFRRNLLSFKDICHNGYHIETRNKDNIECLYITSITLSRKLILEKLPTLSSVLYFTKIKQLNQILCTRSVQIQILLYFGIIALVIRAQI